MNNSIACLPLNSFQLARISLLNSIQVESEILGKLNFLSIVIMELRTFFCCSSSLIFRSSVGLDLKLFRQLMQILMRGFSLITSLQIRISKLFVILYKRLEVGTLSQCIIRFAKSPLKRLVDPFAMKICEIFGMHSSIAFSTKIPNVMLLSCLRATHIRQNEGFVCYHTR